MFDLRHTLQQLERIDVPEPRAVLEDAIWREMLEELERTTWRDRLPWSGLPSPRRRLVLAVAGAAVGLLAALAAIGLVDRLRSEPAPIVDDPVPTQPAPDALPPFRATVEVTARAGDVPEVDSDVTLVFEVSHDGDGGLRRELVDVRAADPQAWEDSKLATTAFVITRGRDVAMMTELVFVREGSQDPAHADDALDPTFTRTSVPDADPTHLDPVLLLDRAHWERVCDLTTSRIAAVAGRDASTHVCSDWAGDAFEMTFDDETGLLLGITGAERPTGLFEYWLSPGYTPELRVVELELDPVFDTSVFDVDAAADATSQLPGAVGFSDRIEPTRPLGPVRMTVRVHGEAPDADGALVPFILDADWSWSGPDLWRFDTLLVEGPPEAFAHTSESTFWDGVRQTELVNDTGEYHRHDAPMLPPFLLLAAGSYFTDHVQMGAYGTLDEFLTSEVCEIRGTVAVIGRAARDVRCTIPDGAGPGVDVTEELLVDEATDLVLSARATADDQVLRHLEVTELDTAPEFGDGWFDPALPEDAAPVVPAPTDDPFAAPPLALEVGEMAPDWEVTGAAGHDGPLLSLRELEGFTVVVLIMRSDCPSAAEWCAAFDRLVELSTARRETSHVVWIDTSGSPAEAARLVAAQPNAWVTTAGHAPPPDGGIPGITDAWGMRFSWLLSGYPTWVVVDAQGVVTRVETGVPPIDELRALLAGPGA